MSSKCDTEDIGSAVKSYTHLTTNVLCVELKFRRKFWAMKRAHVARTCVHLVKYNHKLNSVISIEFTLRNCLTICIELLHMKMQ